MRIFAERLSALLNERGVTQKEVALKAGITEAAMSKYLKNERQPRMVTVSAIADALNVPAWELMGENPKDAENTDDAIRLIARNAENLTPEQKEQIIRAISKTF